MTQLATDAASMSAADAMRRLDQVDLSMIRMKLADPNEGKGWSFDQLDRAEREYRRFLALHLMYPEMAVVPCGMVDEVWHAHILDTFAYGPDCEKVFGFFLHHFPYFGMRGEQDAADLSDAYELTLTRYELAFGEPPAGVWRPEDNAKCGRTNCKPQKCR
ncbi:glycine-rich domain-containing protein [uncultured Jatrophihabitans sp.]|uniref:glycine-rich domain-containing protein n=1 Tax=uncultured Jatrophihabitans sp. TaxID=1610747 RepID=UPI0035CB6895